MRRGPRGVAFFAFSKRFPRAFLFRLVILKLGDHAVEFVEKNSDFVAMLNAQTRRQVVGLFDGGGVPRQHGKRIHHGEAEHDNQDNERGQAYTDWVEQSLLQSQMGFGEDDRVDVRTEQDQILVVVSWVEPVDTDRVLRLLRERKEILFVDSHGLVSFALGKTKIIVAERRR